MPERPELREWRLWPRMSERAGALRGRVCQPTDGPEQLWDLWQPVQHFPRAADLLQRNLLRGLLLQWDLLLQRRLLQRRLLPRRPELLRQPVREPVQRSQ
jgi:hypothetical protein